MSVWPIGDGFRAVSAQSRELLNSWNTNDDDLEDNASDTAAVRAALLDDLQDNIASRAVLPSMEIETPGISPVLYAPSQPVAEPVARMESSKLETSVSENLLDRGRVNEKIDRAAFSKYVPLKDTSVSPLTRVNQILEEHSESSRWLNQRGYLDAFKSPNCVLDITFSSERTLLKVGAVLNAPDGSKRTVVACDDGTSFQRITGPGGREIVRFMANGQIVELGKRSGEMLKPKTTELERIV